MEPTGHVVKEQGQEVSSWSLQKICSGRPEVKKYRHGLHTEDYVVKELGQEVSSWSPT